MKLEYNRPFLVKEINLMNKINRFKGKKLKSLGQYNIRGIVMGF